jgi:hypothetical protein
MQQFQSASRTNICFPGQHHDGIRLLGMIDDQEARRLAGERYEDHEDKKDP